MNVKLSITQIIKNKDFKNMNIKLNKLLTLWFDITCVKFKKIN